MRKADIFMGLGLKVLARCPHLDASGANYMMRKFFRGCRTIADLEERIKNHGGYDHAADYIKHKLG